MATKGKRGSSSRIKIVPLGGVGEIGKNMTVIEYENDMIVVDAGSIFPKDDMPGVDLVIPDVSYLTNNADKLRGFVITHGHEDHVGAIPYVLRQVSAPIYGSKLTVGLIENKMKEHRGTKAKLNVVRPGQIIKLGVFSIEFIHVNHSIAGSMALIIHTPLGPIVHSGDFKVDYTPIDNEVMDLGRLGELGRKGVLALLCESTNVERTGSTMSEKKVGETFGQLFQSATGRIIIAMFASNTHRIQQVVDYAVQFNRKVCMVGRSMVNVSKTAMQLGYLKIPEGHLLSIDEINQYKDDEIIVMTTGSQGEPMSGLARMAFGEHRKLEIRPSDMIIISASPIPGNEKSVSRVIDELVHTGANVIYESLAEVHVSGHARQEELKLIHALTKPKFFIPIHGEYRHLYHHVKLAKAMGMQERRTHIAAIGEVIEIGRNSMRPTGTVPSGRVLIDGLGVGDVGNVVLRDRKHLSEDGLLIVVMAIDHVTGKVTAGPDIISRGFVYVRESEDIVKGAKDAAQAVLNKFKKIEPGDWSDVKGQVREAVNKYVYSSIKRSPMILPIIVEI